MSIKAASGALGLLLVGLLATWAAEWYYESSNPIRFGLDMGRPWNFFDVVWASAFVLSGALFVVSLMFLRRND